MNTCRNRAPAVIETSGTKRDSITVIWRPFENSFNDQKVDFVARNGVGELGDYCGPITGSHNTEALFFRAARLLFVIPRM